MDKSADHRPLAGLVLSGGGARGAYEVGVLKYLFERFADETAPLFRVLTGSSVGAVHAAYVAGSRQGRTAAEGLAKLWLDMRLRETVQVNWRWIRRQAMRYLFSARNRPVPRGERPAVFDTCHLERMILRSVDWRGVQRELRAGHVHGLALPSTDIGTGKAVVFYQTDKTVPDLHWRNDPHIVGRRALLGPRHVLASAAIPMFFPPVNIDGRLYSDGSLRVNTPLSPALRLGAERLLVIRLRSPEAPEVDADQAAAAVTDPVYLAGKAFDAIMLDPVDRDFKTLEMINALITRLSPAQQDVTDWSLEHRGAAFKPVRAVAVTPTESLTMLATEALHEIDKVPRLFRRYLDSPSQGSDLLSYFLFDGKFTGRLIELGYEDARRSHAELEGLFAS